MIPEFQLFKAVLPYVALFKEFETKIRFLDSDEQ